MTKTVEIFHNPNCGTSRNTLAMIKQVGLEPIVVEYLKNPPSKETLLALIAEIGLGVRHIIREKGTPYEELGLSDLSLSDEALVDAILAHPILMNRPIVRTSLGTKLCRPSELVLEILPASLKGQFVKEDGEIVGGAAD